MTVEFDESGMNELGAQIRAVTERALQRGVELAEGEPLEQAVETVAREMEEVGLSPVRSEIRAHLAERGWK